jgi:hypothetical protein
MNQHLIPFIQKLHKLDGKSSDKVKVDFYWDKVNGHNPMGTDLTIKIIERAFMDMS